MFATRLTKLRQARLKSSLRRPRYPYQMIQIDWPLTNSEVPQNRGVEFRSPSCQNYTSLPRIRLILAFQEARCEHCIILQAPQFAS